MSEETSESQPTRLLTEEAPRKDNTGWIVAGIVAVVALLGCCLVAVVLGAIGMLIPMRAVTVYQIVTSGPLIIGTSTPTPVFVLPLDTPTPLSPSLATEAPGGISTPIPDIVVPPDDLFASPPAGAQTGAVVKIIDGDTIDVNIDGQVFRVRYIGINTPETGDTCGSEATAANQAFVDGHQVTLVKDTSETERYDRLLRYVYVGETFVNAQLVRDGWPRRWLTRRTRSTPICFGSCKTRPESRMSDVGRRGSGERCHRCSRCRRAAQAAVQCATARRTCTTKSHVEAQAC